MRRSKLIFLITLILLCGEALGGPKPIVTTRTPTPNTPSGSFSISRDFTASPKSPSEELTSEESSSKSFSMSLSTSASLSSSYSNSEEWSVSGTQYTTPPFPTGSSLSLSFTYGSLSKETSTSDSYSMSMSLSNEQSRSKSLSDEVSNSMTLTPTVTPPPTLTRKPTRSASLSLESSKTKSMSDEHSRSDSLSSSLSSEASKSKSPSRTYSFSHSLSSEDSKSKSASSTYSLSSSGSLSQELSKTGSPSEELSTTVSLIPTPSPTKTMTNEMSASDSVSSTVSNEHSRSDSTSPSNEWTATPSANKSFTPSMDASQSQSGSASWTSSLSTSASFSPEISASPSQEGSASLSHSFSITMSQSLSGTASVTHDATDTGSGSHSASPSATITGFTDTEVGTVSLGITISKSLTADRSTSMSFSQSVTLSPSTSATASVTTSPTQDRSVTPSNDPTSSRSLTLSQEHTSTESKSPSLSVTLSASQSMSNEISASASISGSSSVTMTDEMTSTRTLVITDTLSLTVSMSEEVTMTETGSFSVSESMPLTTSALPPTTTPVPTPTFTLPTHCPTDCQNGVCQQATQFVRQYVFYCVCYASAQRGFWAGSERGGPCDRCARGYWGGLCTQVCPGGTCAICNGHGTCSDGMTGTGECTCYNSTRQGFWGGSSCNICQSQYYGTSCLSQCVCESHGKCNEGVFGDGTCRCDVGWTGLTCGKCDETTNVECSSLKTCPGADNNCNGHGICNFTYSDSGFCDCNATYATEDCSVQCPNLCSGHGFCRDGRTGDGTCACNANYQPPGCATCLRGYYGFNNNCLGQCPGGVQNPCSNNGTCLDTGVCQCHSTRGGLRCELECPVSPTNYSLVCNGHGVCTGATAYCVCYNDTTRGFWTGTACTACDTYHGGPSCTVVCPVSPQNGEICGGPSFGFCNKTTGACTCAPNKCGQYCDVDMENGECQKCPVPLHYGYNCTGVCLCVHGNCSDGKAGDGSCRCEFGWAGPYCNITCEGGILNPCSQHGTCIQSTAGCKCDPGYASADCSVQCLGGGTCNNKGECLDGAERNGTCVCRGEYVWPETGCSSVCDCSGHGRCDFPNISCICSANFTGPRCEQCVAGNYGNERCSETCYFGDTVGYNCSCFTGYAGASCVIRCPYSANGVCNNRGLCDRVSGVCRCETGWVGPACTCSNDLCKASNIYTICSASLGSCICISTRTGSNCESCVFGYYGAVTNGVSCTTACDCNSNGPCDMTTGVCSCFSDSFNGYWTGGTCNQCQAGYMGSKCTQKSNGITQTTDLSRKVSVSCTASYTYFDKAGNALYIGGDCFNARFNVETVIPATPETNTLGFTTYGERLSGSIVALEKSAENSSKLLFVVHMNSSETHVPELYESSSHPLLTQITNISRYALGDTGLQFNLQYAVLNQNLGRVCGVPMIAAVTQLFCRGIGPATDANQWSMKELGSLKTLGYIDASTFYNGVLFSGISTSQTCVFFKGSYLPEIERLTIPVDTYITTQNGTCKSLTCFYEMNGILYFSALTPTAYIGAYDLNRGIFYTGTLVGGVVPCRAMMYDPETNIGYAVYSSLVVKFEVYDQTKLRAYGQIYTTSSFIMKFLIDSRLQLAYAPASTASGYQVLRFLLVEISSFTPNFADRRGGVVVTIFGKGFRNVTGARCYFDSDETTVTFLNETAITCVAPPKVSSAVCLSQVLEVSMNGILTKNNFLIERPTSVSIEMVTPDFVRVRETSLLITLTGRGFSSSPFAVCRFVDPIRGFMRYSPATFFNQTYICTAPTEPTPWSANSYVHISLDGTVYSTTTVSFLIIGVPIGIVMDPVFSTTSSVASRLSPLPLVYVVDENANRLLSIDTAIREGRVLPPTDGNTTWTLRNSVGNSSRGILNLQNLTLENPQSGNFLFRVVMGLWETNFTITVVSGEVQYLIIKPATQITSADIVTPGHTLPKSVEVLALDSGNNTATSVVGQRAFVALARYSNGAVDLFANETTWLPFLITFTSSGAAGLGAALIYPIFGVEYSLFFRLESNFNINVSTNSFFPRCDGASYFVNGTTTCLDCDKAMFSCDGTEVVVTLAGHWRSNSLAASFYTCPTPQACLHTGVCAPGYTGPMCGVCDDGYGRDFSDECVECPLMPVSIVLFILIVLFQIIFLFVTLVIVIQNWSTPNSLFLQAAVSVSITFCTFQTLSVLGGFDSGWPDALRDMLSVVGIVFAFEIDRILAVDCLLRTVGINALWFALVYSLIVILLIPTIAFVASWILKRQPNLLLMSAARRRREALLAQGPARAKAFLQKRFLNDDGTPYIKEHHRKAILLNTCQVVVTFCFQTSCRSALEIFRCVAIDYGDRYLSFLSSDLSVSCDDALYQSIANFSTFLVFVYVIAIPSAFVFGTAYSRKRHAEEDYHLYTALTTVGIQDVTFFWNGLLFFRRALLVAVEVFLDEPIQSWIAMWALTGMSWMQFYLNPWNLSKHNRIERVGFLSLTVISNLSLVYGTTGEGSPGRNAVSILIFIVVSCLFAYTLYEIFYIPMREQQARIREKALHDDEGGDERAIGLGDLIRATRREAQTAMNQALAGIVTKDELKSAANKVRSTANKVADKLNNNKNQPTTKGNETLDNPSGRMDTLVAKKQKKKAQRRLQLDNDSNDDFGNDVDSVDSTDDDSSESYDSQDDDHDAASRSSRMSGVKGDPESVRRMELERDIDQFIASNNCSVGIYRQAPNSNSLFDSRYESPQALDRSGSAMVSPTIARPQNIEDLLRSRQRMDPQSQSKLRHLVHSSDDGSSL